MRWAWNAANWINCLPSPRRTKSTLTAKRAIFNAGAEPYLAERAQLIGAIRLPNNAFLANAGTQVTTDILFLQKREKLMDVSMPEPDSGLEWLHLGQTEDGVPVNQYFLDHPEMLLGKMAFDRSFSKTTWSIYSFTGSLQTLKPAGRNPPMAGFTE